MSWVRAVLEALEIEHVREERSRYWGICPFHQEKGSPASWATAFFVRKAGKRRDAEGKPYEAAGQYFCFTCAAAGPLRKLVMHVRGCDEAAARAFIKKRGGERGSKVEELKHVAVVVRREKGGRARYALPREVIFEPLALWVTPARDYARSRGVTDEEVDLFGIGYAVDGGKLSSRIVFPWRGSGGEAHGYSARTFVDAEPKYTTPGPDERGVDNAVMFGEHLWPPRSGRDLVAVTEGALNGLAVRRALLELEPVAQLASMGGTKNFSAEHGKKLATFRRVLIVTDPDLAGNKAAQAVAGMVGRYAKTSRARLPRGKDALDAGPEALRRSLALALSRLSR